MFLIPQVNQCKNCKSLKDLLLEIDCSLYNLIKNRWDNERYGTESYFSIERFKALSTYKRILTHKMFNCKYTNIDIQDIIPLVERLLYGNLKCSRCLECTDTATTTTSSSSTSTTSSTTTSHTSTSSTTTTILL